MHMKKFRLNEQCVGLSLGTPGPPFSGSFWRPRTTSTCTFWSLGHGIAVLLGFYENQVISYLFNDFKSIYPRQHTAVKNGDVDGVGLPKGDPLNNIDTLNILLTADWGLQATGNIPFNSGTW